MRRGSLIALVVLLGLGCQPEPGRDGRQPEPEIVRTGVIMPECAPWDGAAYRIVLAPGAACEAVPAPRIELWAYRGFPIRAGSAVEFGSRRDDGLGLDCPGAGPCAPAIDGVIDFDRFDEGVAASGTYALTLADGRRLRGRFDALWCAVTPLCG